MPASVAMGFFDAGGGGRTGLTRTGSVFAFAGFLRSGNQKLHANQLRIAPIIHHISMSTVGTEGKE
jgi:hypothetical protein